MNKLNSNSGTTTLIGIEQPETLRAPEIEKGVGCDFDNYLLVPDNTLGERIAAAKAKLGRDVVILGHHYQRDEVVKFADYRGDSLKLSQQAAEVDGKYIVFCGVHFMAESADILRRDQQVVVLPDLNAGCSMADMADIGQGEACWNELGSVTDTSKIIPVTDMNSTAAIKPFTGEHAGSGCTSTNAPAVMKWAFARGEKVLFLPDEHLGRNTGYRMGIPLDEMIVWDPFQELGGNSPEAIAKARVILWKGYCSVHSASLRNRSRGFAASIREFALSFIRSAALKWRRRPTKLAQRKELFAPSKRLSLEPSGPSAPKFIWSIA